MNLLIIGDLDFVPYVYADSVLAELPSETRLLAPPFSSQDPERFEPLLAEVDALMLTWGAPVLDAALLDKMPRLKAVFYGAGTIKNFVTDAFWERGIPICSAWASNATPVAEFTYAHIVLGLKHAFWLRNRVRADRQFPDKRETFRLPSLEDATVGICSLGMIGRMVRDRLRALNVRVIAHDPFLAPESAKTQGVEARSLDDLFKESDVLSIHTPWLPETEGMIRGSHLASMRTGATVINTSRGAVINEPEIIEVLRARPDLQAILDVTYPEPPPPESPLYDLENVFLTPHIAGSQGAECQQMGRAMVSELQRFVAGEALQHQVTQAMLATMA